MRLSSCYASSRLRRKSADPFFSTYESKIFASSEDQQNPPCKGTKRNENGAEKREHFFHVSFRYQGEEIFVFTSCFKIHFHVFSPTGGTSSRDSLISLTLRLCSTVIFYNVNKNDLGETEGTDLLAELSRQHIHRVQKEKNKKGRKRERERRTKKFNNYVDPISPIFNRWTL